MLVYTTNIYIISLDDDHTIRQGHVNEETFVRSFVPASSSFTRCNMDGLVFHYFSSSLFYYFSVLFALNLHAMR